MEFGIGYFPTHDGIGPGEVAALVEDYGFESLAFAEHSHTPVSRESPYPGGGEMPAKYHHCYELFVALTAAAAATSRLRLLSGVCLVAQRDPIHTAKQTASLDRLSGGRFEFGVGAGWNREEMANHGTDPRTRMRRMVENVEAIREIWTQEEASYHGEFVDFEPIWQWPKPAQRPHPPVLVGGDGPTVGDRVAAIGDAWIPNYFPEAVERWREIRQKIDRPIELQYLGAPVDPRVIEVAAGAGVSRYAEWMPSGPRWVVEQALEDFARAIAQFNGEL